MLPKAVTLVEDACFPEDSLPPVPSFLQKPVNFSGYPPQGKSAFLFQEDMALHTKIIAKPCKSVLIGNWEACGNGF